MATMTRQLPQAWGEANEAQAARRFERWMKTILEINRAMENTLVDVVAAMTPWIAPLVPAAIGYMNVKQYLGFEPWLAFVYALVVEFLGLATVTTALQFWSWNQETPLASPQIQVQDLGGKGEAPFLLALVTALFYLVITLAVNVILDQGTVTVRVVKALASTFSIVGALTLALRSQQAKRQAAVDEAKAQKLEQSRQTAEQRASEERRQLETLRLANEKEIAQARIVAETQAQERKEARQFRHEEKLAEIAAKVAESQAKVSAQVPESSQKVAESKEFPETFGKWSDWRQVPEEQRRRIGGMTIKQVHAEYGVIEKTAGNWIKNSHQEFGD
jgi:hypothetical protein